MDLTRLRAGELLAGAAALALLLSLFLDWNQGRDAETGWESLGVIALAFVLAALVSAGALVVFTATKRPAAIPIGAAVITSAVGLLATLVLAVRVVLLDDSLGGAYLGLLFTFLVLAGGWLTMRDERTGAPYSAAPDLPRRPAPPAEA